MDTDLAESVRALGRPLAAEPSTGRSRLVCEECGRVEPLHDARTARALGRLVRRVALSRADWELTIFGLCDRCSE